MALFRVPRASLFTTFAGLKVSSVRVEMGLVSLFTPSTSKKVRSVLTFCVIDGAFYIIDGTFYEDGPHFL
jgi:hypothetical protein